MSALLTCNRRYQVRTSVVTPTIPSDSSRFYSVVPENTRIVHGITLLPLLTTPFPSIIQSPQYSPLYQGWPQRGSRKLAVKNANNNHQVVYMQMRMTANGVLNSVVKYTTNTHISYQFQRLYTITAVPTEQTFTYGHGELYSESVRFAKYSGV
jgi:hypothetical protein